MIRVPEAVSYSAEGCSVLVQGDGAGLFADAACEV
jgi:hypothetical protein